LTRAFAKAQLGRSQEFERQVRIQWSKYYLCLAARGLVLGESKERYWNALEPFNRDLIDPEWPNIQEVLAWADQQRQDEILVELMVLVAHYMTSRMLFPIRLYYAQKAAEAASRLGRKADAALLHIDGCGWILLEEGYLTEAREEVTAGLRIAQTLDASSPETTDLIALANVWLARIFLEQGDLVEASVLIDKVVSLEYKPIIQKFVSAIAGDIAYGKNNMAEAMRHYKNAYQIGNILYEGEVVELLDRLGNVYLAIGDIVQAEASFKQSLNTKPDFGEYHMPYAKYGLARVAQVKGERDKARQIAQEILTDLSRAFTAHKLLNEIHIFLKSLEDIS
jgi:predicted negative regulator of RcsB-dependent stress response